MREHQYREAEQSATLALLDFIEKDFAGLPVRVVAGALMRTSVALAIEVFGPDFGARATRRALENILNQPRQRKLQ
tara:strand:- start:6305 stop:6532 length:228 start_codon:yes stop_codon:yes gene_type:complete